MSHVEPPPPGAPADGAGGGDTGQTRADAAQRVARGMPPEPAAPGGGAARDQARLESITEGDLPPADDTWLVRFTADEWLRAGLGELERAERALAGHDRARAAATLKRAAGMALNAALRVAPDPSWGRTYVDHLRALTLDERVPSPVRAAARHVLEARPPAGPVVALAGPSADAALLEAARTVMAHAYACVVRGSPTPGVKDGADDPAADEARARGVVGGASSTAANVASESAAPAVPGAMAAVPTAPPAGDASPGATR